MQFSVQRVLCTASPPFPTSISSWLGYKFLAFLRFNIKTLYLRAVCRFCTDYRSSSVFISQYTLHREPGSVVGLATVWTVLSSNPGGVEIFRTCQNRPWGPPSLLYNGYRIFPGGKVRPERDSDPSPLLVPRSRKSRGIHLLPLWAVRPIQSHIACTRVYFFLVHITSNILRHYFRMFRHANTGILPRKSHEYITI